MRTIMAIFVGMLCSIALVANADAASQEKPQAKEKSCAQICSTRVGAYKSRCMTSCEQRR